MYKNTVQHKSIEAFHRQRMYAYKMLHGGGENEDSWKTARNQTNKANTSLYKKANGSGRLKAKKAEGGADA